LKQFKYWQQWWVRQWSNNVSWSMGACSQKRQKKWNWYWIL